MTAAQAQADLGVVSQRFKQSIDYGGTLGARVSRSTMRCGASFRQAFFVLAGAVACVLAIACVNLSNLLLARINVRRQEFAVRVALGRAATPPVQQTLAESLLLAFAGSLIGVPLAIWATRALAAPADVRRAAAAERRGRSARSRGHDRAHRAGRRRVRRAAGVCIFARGSRLAAERHAPAQRRPLRRRSRATRWSSSKSRSPACCSSAPASSSGASARCSRSISASSPSMPCRGGSTRRGAFNSLAEANEYLDGVVRTVAALPGVEAVGLSDVLPLGRNRTWGVRAKGVEYPPGQGPSVFPRIVDQHYLQAMQIPLRRGPVLRRSRHRDQREDRHHQRAPRARALARSDAIGQQITQNGGSTVIGVVADVRHGSLEKAGGNEMYLHYRQIGDWQGMEMVVRSARPSASLVPDVRARARQLRSRPPNR